MQDGSDQADADHGPICASDADSPEGDTGTDQRQWAKCGEKRIKCRVTGHKTPIATGQIGVGSGKKPDQKAQCTADAGGYQEF